MENIIVKYSELIEDDGGFGKLKADFMKLGDDLVADAKRLKKEFNDAFSLDNPESVARYEAQVAKLVKVNESYEQAKKDLIAIEKQYQDTQRKSIDLDVKSERAKQAKADTVRKELQAERELDRGIQQSNATKKSDIALSEAQRRQREILEKTIRKEKDAYGEMSAELNKLFRASASVAVQMYRLEEAGRGAGPEYARLASEFTVLQGRTQKLDKALKDIDKSLGRNQRNVGNYQFDSLGNSIQQILRETPSAAVSLNTFFLAISNNLPFLFDSLGDLTEELKQLKEVARTATEEMIAQQAAQATASQISEQAQESLSAQVEGVISSITASQEQALAIREQVAAHVAEIETTGSASAATVANTEAVLINAGATVDQTVAVQRQIGATGQANAVTAQATAAQNAHAAAAARATAALAAQPSILSRVRASLFSLNTALTLGVLALTLFGGKLIDLASELFNFNTQLSELEKTQLRFNASQNDAQKEYAKQEENVKSLQKTAKDEELTYEARMIAVEKLREQYQFYYKDLTDAQILSKEYSKSEAALLVALNKRTQAINNQKQVDDVRSRIIDIRQELKERDAIFGQMTRLREEAEKLQVQDQRTGKIRKINSKEELFASLKRGAEIQEELKALEKRAEKFEAYNKTLEEGNELRKFLNETSTSDLRREADSLEKFLIPKQNEINKLQAESILLDYRKKESRKALQKEQIKSVDYLASEYEFIRTALDNTIQNNRDIFESDRYTLEQRLAARELFLKQMKTLADFEREEQLRVLKKTYDEERTATIKSSDGLTKISKFTKQGLIELQKQYNFDALKIEEDFQQKLVGIARESEEVDKLQQLQMQIQKLERDRQFFSKSSDMYKAFTKEISVIQNEINKIVNPFAGLELSDQIQINDAELRKVKIMRDKLREILDGKSLYELSPIERKSVLKQIEEFEKERTRSEKNYEVQRKQSRIAAIEAEQTQFEKDTDEFKQLETERQSILLDLENKAIDDMLEAQKEKADKFKKFLEELNTIVGAVIDRMIEVTQKRVEDSQKLVENQADSVEDQAERARNGLSNTLAFEQEELAKREAELIKQQKREQRLQKIKALYSSYAGYADKDPDTAIIKALRDFAILEAVTASFGEGGVVEDKLPADGIFRGASHRSRRGGIPIMVEGKEGIFSTREMANLGKDNFYRMKELAGMGKIDENFFSRQRNAFVQTVAVPVNNDDIITHLQDVKRAIENKPVPNWRIGDIVNGTMELVETIHQGNKEIRNHYRTRKPRL